MDEQMTKEELRARRHRLGVTSEWMAAHLRNLKGAPLSHDTYRRWESGREAVPPRMMGQIGAIEAMTQEWVDTVRGWIADGDPTPWEPPPFVQPGWREHSQWWGQVVLRAIIEAERDPRA